jgi:hypothetical protein
MTQIWSYGKNPSQGWTESFPERNFFFRQTFQRVNYNKNKNDIKYSSSIEGWEVGS